MVRLTATDVSRSFSAVMNRVDAGEEIEIVRNGVPVAELRPAPRRQTLSAERWRELMASAPAVDDDFAGDVARAREAVGPPDAAWPS
ncbi:type II toxin-antitoxin system Phd/YefM family antitoxin [Conexibacter sp. CPCC 206217]|uniref:type II toxin-antitoxin system Phd/YefM family antitoxin n=1 Tax=Conexibacter sp. CPCC 206217 TaxID=3064574 RepID=UPI00271C167C|nr:type II toxin-antitoxin system prevent-host-death family antitoxin [Conexibacter sp. CPCC 206217]MDO8212303.1 type II toxin-antitoxin system prevent-host-death family antitoxin [Conexibacter sp. CPCC 206217]